MRKLDMQREKLTTLWKITKYADAAAYAAGQAFDEVEIEGNVALNEGIGLLLDLLIGAGGTVYSNANAYLGVGDAATAESASHTGLQAVTNKTYKAMEATFPSRSGQTLTFKAVFGSSDANYAWNEFTIVNASSDTGANLNRKVSAEGTKASGQTWTLTATVTQA